VLVHFPFSDLSASKLRPAVVLADAGRGDWILCQITSNPYADQDALLLESVDFSNGSLQRSSFVRPGKLFTAHTSLMAGHAGQLTPERSRAVPAAVLTLFQRGLP
jgi:mRNA interferase MazF